MSGLLAAVFVASLLGSLHCVGMCGPFAIMAGTHRSLPMAANQLQSVNRKQWSATVASYHLGRLLTYLILGIASGFAGMAIDFGGDLAGWQQTATYLAGGLMIAVGGVSLARQAGWRICSPNFVKPIVGAIQRGFRSVSSWPPVWRSLAIGSLTTWMPCGWLYVFVIAAAGVADPWYSALLMITFWAGSIPILVVVALGASTLTSHRGINVSLITALLVIGIGVFTLLFRAPVSLPTNAKITHDLREIQQQVEQVEQEELPCCAGK